MLSVQYAIYTVILSLFPLGVLALLITQILADRYGKQKITDRVQRVLLYSVYISALLCCCIGYSLHHSQHIPEWCQIYGLPPCFGVLGATKGFLYAFFLRRARKANAYNINDRPCVLFLFDRIGPLYIFIYWLIYVSLAAIFFSGERTDKEGAQLISWCLFDSWEWWFVIFSNSVDVFNCVVTLLLFLWPLINSLKRLRMTDNVNQRLSHKFMKTMRWNVVLSSIATLSSVMLLVCIPIVKEYIWLFCGGDPFINSVCVFMMMASNRRFVKRQWLKRCCVDRLETRMRTHTQTDTFEATVELPSSHVEPFSYNMEAVRVRPQSTASPDFNASPEIISEDVASPEYDANDYVVPLDFQSFSNVLPRPQKTIPTLEHHAQSRSY